MSLSRKEAKSIMYQGSTLSYPHSRTVRLTSNAGAATNSGSSLDYASGFSCYPPPTFKQCNLPAIIEQGKDYKITGIVQDESHARVNLLISWNLTKFGLELKPYAAAVAAREQNLGDKSAYIQFTSLYGWEHLLNSHAESGYSPAAVLFQKFDDGWRIVDENGKSEKDFN